MDHIVCCTGWNVSWCLFSVSRQIPGNTRSTSRCKCMQDDYVSSYWTFCDRAGEIIQTNQAPFGSQFYSFLNVFWFFLYNIWAFLRSRWLHDVRCRSAAARLLGLRVRIPSGGMDIYCECCVWSERVYYWPIPRPEESYRVWSVWMCSQILDSEEA